jgi:hypothetical protein
LLSSLGKLGGQNIELKGPQQKHHDRAPQFSKGDGYLGTFRFGFLRQIPTTLELGFMVLRSLLERRLKTKQKYTVGTKDSHVVIDYTRTTRRNKNSRILITKLMRVPAALAT